MIAHGEECDEYMEKGLAGDPLPWLLDPENPSIRDWTVMKSGFLFKIPGYILLRSRSIFDKIARFNT
jgi:hypothetical protein